MSDVKVDIDTAKFEKRTSLAQKWLKNEAMKDTEPYVPAQTKSLVNRANAASAFSADDEIVYPGPYAGFQYQGKVMIDPRTGSAYASKGARKVLTDKDLQYSKSVNPNAQSHWFEASKAANGEKWREGAAKIIDGG